MLYCILLGIIMLSALNEKIFNVEHVNVIGAIDKPEKPFMYGKNDRMVKYKSLWTYITWKIAKEIITLQFYSTVMNSNQGQNKREEAQQETSQDQQQNHQDDYDHLQWQVNSIAK